MSEELAEAAQGFVSEQGVECSSGLTGLKAVLRSAF